MKNHALDAALEARAKAAYELLRCDPEVDRLDLLAAVVCPPAQLQGITKVEAGCGNCGRSFARRRPGDRYCGDECRRQGKNRRNRAHYAQRRDLAA